MVLELHLGDMHGTGTQSAKKQFINYVSERWSAKVATDVAKTTDRTSETTAHNTAERDATATKQRVSGQLDDSEMCAITWSHIASTDAGRVTTVG